MLRHGPALCARDDQDRLVNRPLLYALIGAAVLTVAASLLAQGVPHAPVPANAPSPEAAAPPVGEGAGSTGPEAPQAPPQIVARGHRSSVPLSVGVLLFASGLASLPFTAATLRWALLVPLFSRLRPDDLLTSPARARIVELLQAEPGLGIKDVCERLDIGWGTAVHHLARLESAGLLTSRDSGRRRRFFPPNTSAAVRTALCVLTTDINRRLLEYVRGHPGATQTDACRALGLSPPLVHKYAKRLEAEGLLTAERHWRTVQYYAADSAASHLQAYAAHTASQEAKGLVAPSAEA